MQIDLSNRTVLVTGATSGIGLAAARSLVESGASAVITGLTQAEVDQGLGKPQSWVSPARWPTGTLTLRSS